MAISALHSAATGLRGLSTELDVLANNLANVNTTGFKRSRVNFEDLLYQTRRQPGVENAIGDTTPAGLQVGLGTRVSNTQYDYTQGAPEVTNRPLDITIEGDGFFRVRTPNEIGGGVGYTRAGNFFRNVNGDIVLGNSDGLVPLDGINVPEDVPDEAISISASGEVSYINPDGTSSVAGQIELATFVNNAGLKSIGSNILIETAASGPPIVDQPTAGSFGRVLQGYLESSNVDPVKELVALIKTQRAFELNSQTIQAADEVLQVVGNLRR